MPKRRPNPRPPAATADQMGDRVKHEATERCAAEINNAIDGTIYAESSHTPREHFNSIRLHLLKAGSALNHVRELVDVESALIQTAIESSAVLSHTGSDSEQLFQAALALEKAVASHRAAASATPADLLAAIDQRRREIAIAEIEAITESHFKEQDRWYGDDLWRSFVDAKRVVIAALVTTQDREHV